MSSYLQKFYNKKFIDEHYGKDTVYLNMERHHYHQKIINIVKKESIGRTLKILDIGCATGYLGKAVKLNNNYVCGVEISPIAAEESKKVLDNVAVGNIELIDLPYKENYFDIVICSDILEHLFSPELVLNKIYKYLKREGIFLMVVPNIAWYRMRLMLIGGKWEYGSSGIMDFGHIRWFTKKSGGKLLKNCGFHIKKIIPWIVLPSPINYLMKKMPEVFLKPMYLFDRLLAQAFLYIAYKK